MYEPNPPKISVKLAQSHPLAQHLHKQSSFCFDSQPPNHIESQTSVSIEAYPPRQEPQSPTAQPRNRRRRIFQNKPLMSQYSPSGVSMNASNHLSPTNHLSPSKQPEQPSIYHSVKSPTNREHTHRQNSGVVDIRDSRSSENTFRTMQAPNMSRFHPQQPISEQPEQAENGSSTHRLPSQRHPHSIPADLSGQIQRIRDQLREHKQELISLDAKISQQSQQSMQKQRQLLSQLQQQQKQLTGKQQELNLTLEQMLRVQQQNGQRYEQLLRCELELARTRRVQELQQYNSRLYQQVTKHNIDSYWQEQHTGDVTPLSHPVNVGHGFRDISALEMRDGEAGDSLLGDLLSPLQIGPDYQL